MTPDHAAAVEAAREAAVKAALDLAIYSFGDDGPPLGDLKAALASYAAAERAPLVEIIRGLLDAYEDIIHNEYDGTSMLEGRLNIPSAVAARALLAQEEKR